MLYFFKQLLLITIGSAVFGMIASASDAVPVTILHTNDLHSHFRPQKDALGLGGVARLKTVVDRVRAEQRNTLLFDGGDWSEGQIYYTLNNGTEIIKMMEAIGYDAAVVGNHDWISGPDFLLNMYKNGRSRMGLLAANIDVSRYPNKDEFSRLFLPYTIYSFNGVRVAVIGLVTYEFIYDDFFSPVRPRSPIPVIRDLAAILKEQVDSIIVLSHNNIRMNEEILRTAPDVDLVIGAHDHVKLSSPRVVLRGPKQNPGWVVETGCWGRYLGRVDLRIRKRADANVLGVPAAELRNYKLIQIDSQIPEDPEINSRINQLEAQIENRYGPIFHDHIADAHFEVSRKGVDNLMGNLATDSYLSASPHAEFSLDQIDLIYGQLNEGPLSTADFFASNPAIYNHKTGKAWDLQTFKIKGSTLRWMLNLLFASQPATNFGPVSTSELSFTYNSVPPQSVTGGREFTSSGPHPLLMPRLLLASTPPDDGLSVKNIKIRGKDLDLNGFYTAASSGGILFAIQFINSLLPGAIRIYDLKDSGMEAWRVIKDYAQARSPLTPDKIPVGNRTRSESQDLGFFNYDVKMTPIHAVPDQLKARINVRIRNFGMVASANSGSSLHFYSNRHGTDFAEEPDWEEISKPMILPSVLNNSGEFFFEQDLTFSGANGIYPLRVALDGDAQKELNTTNNEAVIFFKAPLQ